MNTTKMQVARTVIEELSSTLASMIAGNNEKTTLVFQREDLAALVEYIENLEDEAQLSREESER